MKESTSAQSAGAPRPASPLETSLSHIAPLQDLSLKFHSNRLHSLAYPTSFIHSPWGRGNKGTVSYAAATVARRL